MERVYVGNLPPDIRIKDIDDFFRPFGKLIYIDVNHRANPVYAYVQFDSARNAFNAVKSRHGYDYEGYTLQMRLVENEVRKRRDATPPPPPPPMYSDFVNRMGGNYTNSSLSSFQSSSNSQWSNNNRSNMSQQQNMMPYSSGSRSNVSQQYNNSSNRSNVSQQYNNSSNLSNVSQQYNNFSNRSNMQQQQQEQYFNSNRSNMSQNNMMNYSSRNNVNMPQQNSMNYSNNNSNRYISQQQDMNMTNNSNWVIGNNDSWNNSNNDNSWNSGNNNSWNGGNNNSWNDGNNTWSGSNNNSWNGGNNSSYNDVNSWNNGNNNNMGNMGWNNNGNNNGGNNNFNNVAPYVYNANNDPYAKPGFEDSFTRGLSGSGRKWFNRYIRKGFTPEIARSKALEHRTVPYLRDDPKPNPMPDPNDPTNVALETIGNTIINLLSTANTADNYANNDNQMMPTFSNWGGDNFQTGFDMPGPSTSNANRDGDRRSQTRNRVSRQEYYKSLDVLKKLKSKGVQSAKDRLTRKYHTKIVKDYEQFEKTSKPKSRNEREIISSAASGKKYTELTVNYRKKKQQLLLAARRLQNSANKTTGGGAYKKRLRVLMDNYGFTDTEARSLAYHPMEKLQTLLNMKEECDNHDPTKINEKKGSGKSKLLVYRNDIKFLRMNEKYKYEELSTRAKTAIRNCLIRIYRYETEAKLPHIRTKFARLLPTALKQKKGKTDSKKTSNTAKKTNTDNKKTNDEKTIKKDAEKKENNDDNKTQESLDNGGEKHENNKELKNEDNQKNSKEPNNAE